MKASDFISGDYLKKEDLPKGRDVSVVIESYTVAEFDGKKRPVLHFVGKEKGLAMNVTNLTVCREMFGDDMDEWQGKQIKLYADPSVMFAGKMVGAVRIRFVPQVQEETIASDSDEVPF